MPRGTVAVPVAVVPGEEPVDQLGQIVLAPGAQLDQRQTGGGMRREDVQQPVAPPGAEPLRIPGEVDQSALARLCVQLDGVHESPIVGAGYRGEVPSPTDRHYRVVVAKPGLDGHDRGAKVIARALRDAGFEVIYTGLHQTPEQVAETVVQEDADAVGLSLLSGAHMTLFPRVREQLEEKGVGDVLLFGGGIIPDGDIPVLKEKGVAEIFTPGTPMQAIVDWLGEALAAREAR
jgi:methylmalonyl-CoA mutase C-terminal domain/subunit